MYQSLEQAEQIILDNVKFINLVLQEVRKRNSSLQEELNMNYAKKIGLGTPYEEAIKSLRKVKKELDCYLEIIRKEVLHKYDCQLKSKHKKR